MDLLEEFARGLEARNQQNQGQNGRQRAGVRVMERVQVEDVPDLGQGGAAMVGVNQNGLRAIGMMMDEVAQARVIREPCLHPDDAARLAKELREEEEDGIADTAYTCQMCDMGNSDLTSETSEVMRRIYDLWRLNYRSVPDEKIYQMTANEFNKKVYGPMKRIPGAQIRRMTPSMVRYHYKRCDNRSLEKVAWDEIQAIEQQQTFMRYNGIYRKTRRQGEDPVDDDATPPEIDRHSQEQWLKLSNLKLNWCKQVSVYEKEEEKKRGEKGGGAGTAGGSKTHQLRLDGKGFADI
jgi:hypothetical protein